MNGSPLQLAQQPGAPGDPVAIGGGFGDTQGLSRFVDGKTGEEPEFDGEEIRRLEIELGRQQRAWDEFFATQPGDVLFMDYETLAANYRDEVARALAFIGEDPALARELPAPRMVRQSDSMSEEWHGRMDLEFPPADEPDDGP